jgi:hypothetical protein
VTIGDSVRLKSSEVSVCTVPGTLSRSTYPPSGEGAMTLTSGNATVSLCASAEAGSMKSAKIALASAGHVCPVERNRLFAMRTIQPEIPVAGLVPAIHAFPAADRALFEDVGSRNKSGHGGSKVVPVSSAPSYSCSKTRNRSAVAQGRPRRKWRGDFTSFVAARFAPDSPADAAGGI